MRAWPAGGRAQALAARGVARVATLGRRGALRMLAGVGALTAQSAIASCSAAEAVPIIDVAGSDYALIAPDTLPSGPTRFRFHSTGTRSTWADIRQSGIGYAARCVPNSRWII